MVAPVDALIALLIDDETAQKTVGSIQSKQGTFQSCVCCCAIVKWLRECSLHRREARASHAVR